MLSALLFHNSTMDDAITYDKHHTLPLATGYLGLHFSTSVPCELLRVDDKSPIRFETLEHVGRLAFHLSIPNKIDIDGSLDNETVESLLSEYPNVSDRKLMFKSKGDPIFISGGSSRLVTTTVLPKGPIHASFKSSRGIIKSLNRIYVNSSNMKFEFPIGHFMSKLIIPGQFEVEGGLQTPELLFETLNHFSDVPNRKIVFQKHFPRGGVRTKIVLPKGPTGLLFYSDFEDTSGLPVVSTVLVGSSAWHHHIPVDHTITKVIIPNQITIERMRTHTVEQVIDDYPEVEGRIIVLQEFRRDISRAGATITLTLPTGVLGITLSSRPDDCLWIQRVKEGSPLLHKIPAGYCVDSLIIPGELEFIGIEELKSAPFVAQKLKEYSHICNRVLVLQQNKKDVRKRCKGTRFERELV